MQSWIIFNVLLLFLSVMFKAIKKIVWTFHSPPSIILSRYDVQTKVFFFFLHSRLAECSFKMEQIWPNTANTHPFPVRNLPRRMLNGTDLQQTQNITSEFLLFGKTLQLMYLHFRWCTYRWVRPDRKSEARPTRHLPLSRPRPESVCQLCCCCCPTILNSCSRSCRHWARWRRRSRAGLVFKAASVNTSKLNLQGSSRN